MLDSLQIYCEAYVACASQGGYIQPWLRSVDACTENLESTIAYDTIREGCGLADLALLACLTDFRECVGSVDHEEEQQYFRYYGGEAHHLCPTSYVAYDRDCDFYEDY
ncbi:MAG: hypothetical protein ACI81R_003704 [Bradymonadia bacterium]|jgi:hypothetical protein